ncbi:hypothetical protein [Methanohalophilus sp.]
MASISRTSPPILMCQKVGSVGTRPLDIVTDSTDFSNLRTGPPSSSSGLLIQSHLAEMMTGRPTRPAGYFALPHVCNPAELLFPSLPGRSPDKKNRGSLEEIPLNTIEVIDLFESAAVVVLADSFRHIPIFCQIQPCLVGGACVIVKLFEFHSITSIKRGNRAQATQYNLYTMKTYFIVGTAATNSNAVPFIPSFQAVASCASSCIVSAAALLNGSSLLFQVSRTSGYF